MTVPEYLVTFEAPCGPRGGYCTRPHLDRRHTHGRTRTVTLQQRGCPVGGSRWRGWRSLSTLGSANAYFATSENAVPTVLFVC